MIIVKLKGGLANQMFQYAAARRLACICNSCLKLDLSFLNGAQEGCVPRTYELSNFQITAEVATPVEIARISGQKKKRIRSLFSRMLKSSKAELSPGIYQESCFQFDPAVLDLPDNTYLDGYWQSERYFSDIKEIIHQEFTVKTELSGKNIEIASAIRGSESSVSLHVRRGDYVANQRTFEFHGVCAEKYYRNCIEALYKEVTDPCFFVFSDDPGWAEKNLRLDSPAYFMTHNGADKGYEDLRLMSMCRHNIIANSSFSWWGAWLNTYPRKRVYCPDPWFNAPDMDTSDLIPDTWRVMERGQ